MRERTIFVDWDTMNEHLAFVERFRNVEYRRIDRDERLGLGAYIYNSTVTFEVAYKRGGFGAHYVCRKDSNEPTQRITGGEAYRILSMYVKIPEYSDYVGTCTALMWKDKAYEMKRVRAWAYDKNSAFAEAMLTPMPDVWEHKPHRGIVKDGEIGFTNLDEDGNDTYLHTVKTGEFARYIFPAIESPFNRFVETWYKKKRDAKSKAEKDKAKQVLCFAVGYLQRVNPFLRSAIISACNDSIRGFIDENTIYCNTDEIVSLVPRPDLIIGKELGEWKLEHEGEMFASRGFNYQWGNNTPTYRGVPKTWFKPGWDIIKDSIPQSGNLVEFNHETFRLEMI